MANDKDFKVKNGIQPTVYHEGVGTVVSGSEGYSLAGASYDSVDFSVASQDSTPISITFKPDGTKLYMNGSSTVFQYTLSTAWDLSTASYENKSYNANTQLANGGGAVAFKPDGTKMFILSNSGSYGDDVFRYSLSTAWDVSSASYDNNTVDVEAQETGTRSLALNSDGTKLFILGDSSGEVLVWTLSSAYDLSTASYDASEYLDTSGQDNSPKGMSFSSDGSKLFIMGNQTDKVHKYNLNTAFDLSTASYSNESLLVSSQDTAMRSVALKSDGTKMYTVGFTNDKVYQYSTVAYTQTLDLSTGGTFSFTPSGATTVSLTNPPASGTAVGFAVEINGDASAITWPSSVKWPSGTAPTATATKELYTFVTTDGGTTYYGKLAGSDIA